jgi:D-amino peptidase
VKVYISADIEGVSGIVLGKQTTRQGFDYERARKLMTGEVAAAAKGAIEAGAKEIVVNDAHGGGTNLLHEELPEPVRLIQGALRPLGMMQGLDESFNAAMFVGYHSMRGTADGVLNHTISGRSIHGITVNGRPMGETGLNAALAGSFGVPVVMVAGDEAVCREVKELIPEIVTAQTKRGIGSVAAESLHPAEACRQISEAAKEAVGRRESISPLVIDGQVEVTVDFVRTGMTDCAAMIPGTDRKSATTVSYSAPNYREAYSVIRAMIMMAGKYPS